MSLWSAVFGVECDRCSNGDGGDGLKSSHPAAFATCAKMLPDFDAVGFTQGESRMLALAQIG